MPDDSRSPEEWSYYEIDNAPKKVGQTAGLTGKALEDWNYNKGEWARYLAASSGEQSAPDLNNLLSSLQTMDPTKQVTPEEKRRLLKLLETNMGAFTDNDRESRSHIENYDYQMGKVAQIRDAINSLPTVGTVTGYEFAPEVAAPVKPAIQSAPIVAPENNLMTPGAAETTQKEMAPEFKEPWEVEKLYGSPEIQAAIKGPGTAETTNNALISSMGGGDYGAMMKALGLGEDAGLGSYYDNAHRRSSELINQQMAARGGYGSSTAGDLIQESSTNLEADRASKEAQYALQRAAAGQGWASQLGTAANSSQAAELQRLNLGFNAAGNADTSHLNRLNGGFNQAEGAQSLQIQRLQGMFSDALNLGQATSGTAANATKSLFDTDSSLVDAATTGKVAAATNNANTTAQTVGAIGQGAVPLVKAIGDTTQSWYDSPNIMRKAT